MADVASLTQHPRDKNLLWWMVAVLLVATALRLIAFGEVPPGLYHDEAYHGLDVLDVLSGHFPLYFPANNGREPLFIYLISLTVGMLGRSPFALRLPAFFVGTLTVATTAALGRVLFSRRVGLLAASVLAVTLWHVHLSRVGFRAGTLPLFVALTAWQGALGARSGKRCHWLWAGALYGLSFYTYTASRFTPLALAAFGLYTLAVHSPRSARGRRLWSGMGLAGLVALVVVAPLSVYTLSHPDAVLGRQGQVAVFSPAIHGGDPWGMLGDHVLRTLGMFFIRGDRIWRHNVPWRPVFDPVLGVAFILGFLVSARRLRRDPAAGFVLTWTAVMSLPTLLAEDAPHFLRGVGLLPVVTFFPALGLDWLAGRIGRRGTRWLFLVLPVAFALGSTTWAYFGDYARDPMTGYWFERGAVALAGRINEFSGLGWDGRRMLHGTSPAARGLGLSLSKETSPSIYLDAGLWKEWPQVRFLVAAPEAVKVDLEGDRRDEEPGSPVAVFAWPYGDWRRAWSLLPTPAEITVEQGPLSQGDLDSEPFVTYLAFFALPIQPREAERPHSSNADVSVLARFSEGVELLGVEVMQADTRMSLRWAAVSLHPLLERMNSIREGEGRLRVRLRWRSTMSLAEDYTVFLHYLRGGQRIAQADSPPAGGYYPTTVWRPGDVINDDHDLDATSIGVPLPGQDVLRFGLWHPESGQALHLLDEAGNPTGDWVQVPVPPCDP